MNKAIIVLILALITTSMFSQGVQFENVTLKEAIEKAKQENKIVFIDCYTTWCAPCKWMSKEVFTHEKVGNYFNQNFVNLKIDMARGEGPDIEKIYNVVNYPTLLFIDTDMKLLHKLVGGKTVDELIEEAQNALDPNKRITTMDAKYNNGERNLEFLLVYFNALSQASDKHRITEVAKYIVASLPIEKFDNKEMFTILTKANIELGSQNYHYILSNEESLKLKVGSSEYYGLLDGIINNYLFKKSQSVQHLNDLTAVIENCKQDRVTNNQKIMEKNLVYEFYLSHNDLTKWYNLKMEEGKELESPSEYIYFIYELSDLIYENPKFDDAPEIVNNLTEVAHSIANTENGSIFGNFALAKLYVRAKNKDAALKHYNLFISLNKEAKGNNDHSTISLLKKAINNI